MQLHQRDIDLLLDLQDVIDRQEAMSKDELRDLLVEVQRVLRDLLAQYASDPDSK